MREEMEQAGRQRKPGVALLQDAEVGKGMCSNSKYGDRTNAANWKRRETYKLLAMSVAAVGAVFAWSRVWDPDEHFGDHDENKMSARPIIAWGPWWSGSWTRALLLHLQEQRSSQR